MQFKNAEEDESKNVLMFIGQDILPTRILDTVIIGGVIDFVVSVPISGFCRPSVPRVWLTYVDLTQPDLTQTSCIVIDKRRLCHGSSYNQDAAVVVQLLALQSLS